MHNKRNKEKKRKKTTESSTFETKNKTESADATVPLLIS